MARPFEHACRFDAAAHAYMDTHGRQHRSVTQVLADTDCFDFSMVAADVLALAAERGRRVHELTALWDRWRVRDTHHIFAFCEEMSVPYEWRGYIAAYESFLTNTGFRANHAETERPRLVEIAGRIVGMTPDRVGYFPGSRALVVLDLKTGVDLLSHPLQLAGYSLGLERVLQLAMTHNRAALYLDAVGNYRLRHHRQKSDYHAFIDALHGGGEYLTAWKAQRKLTA